MPGLSERIVLSDLICPVIRLDNARRKDKTVGFSVSLGLHALIFILVGVSLITPPDFGVEQGFGSIEVDLIAADAEGSAHAPVGPVVAHEDDAIHTEALEPPEKIAEKNSGSKGQSQVTMQSTGGAITEARPDYLKNPAPAYPEAARRQKQEGSVIVLAFINKEGFPVRVEVERSSGHHVLDQAAKKAVIRWRFRPAVLGGLAVASSVRVPVRFNLEPDSSSNRLTK